MLTQQQSYHFGPRLYLYYWRKSSEIWIPMEHILSQVVMVSLMVFNSYLLEAEAIE